MKSITMAEALKASSPYMVSMICTDKPDGTTNLATVSWWTYLESVPPMIGFSMAKESYTCELLAKNRNLVLTIPGEAMAEQALQCGCVSGRDVNKVEKFDIALTGTTSKFPVHSRLAFVCTLDKTVEVGDCIFFICNIDEIIFNENERQLFAWSGSEKLAVVNQ